MSIVRTRRALITALATAAFTNRSTLVAQTILDRTPPPADRRITWGSDPIQIADLRLPVGDGPFPCAIAIHGGFWRNAYSLDHLGHLCAALTAAGIATWNLEYRRLGDPGGGWPGTFRDVEAGARYLIDHAAELGINPDRIITIGHSAGGHLATWPASLANVPSTSEIHAEPIPLRGAVSLAGLLDLERASALGLSGGATDLLLGGSPAEVPERYAAASPIALVSPPVPVIAIHGDADDLVPFAFSEDYVKAAGGAATLVPLSGMGHFEPIDPDSAAWPAVRDAVLALSR